MLYSIIMLRYMLVLTLYNGGEHKAGILFSSRKAFRFAQSVSEAISSQQIDQQTPMHVIEFECK